MNLNHRFDYNQVKSKKTASNPEGANPKSLFKKILRCDEIENEKGEDTMINELMLFDADVMIVISVLYLIIKVISNISKNIKIIKEDTTNVLVNIEQTEPIKKRNS